MKIGRTDSIRYIILSVAILFIIFGVIREENKEVLKKATHICLQCIGIG